MSYIGSQVRMLFGAGGDPLALASAGSNHQLIPELLSSGSIIGRMTVGSQNSSNSYSAHVIVGAGTTPVGALTAWYSNLPNPDPNNDAHWVQDTNFASIDLSIVANTFRTLPNVVADHVRFKVARTSGTISLILWVKAVEST